MNAAVEKLVIGALDLDPSVTTEQRRAVLDILRHGIRAQPRPMPVQPAAHGPQSAVKPFLRRREAAHYLGCSVRRVDQLKHDGELPFHRIGRRRIVFKTDDLNALMEKTRVAADEVAGATP